MSEIGQYFDTIDYNVYFLKQDFRETLLKQSKSLSTVSNIALSLSTIKYNLGISRLTMECFLVCLERFHTLGIAEHLIDNYVKPQFQEELTTDKVKSILRLISSSDPDTIKMGYSIAFQYSMCHNLDLWQSVIYYTSDYKNVAHIIPSDCFCTLHYIPIYKLKPNINEISLPLRSL